MTIIHFDDLISLCKFVLADLLVTPHLLVANAVVVVVDEVFVDVVVVVDAVVLDTCTV